MRSRMCAQVHAFKERRIATGDAALMFAQILPIAAPVATFVRPTRSVKMDRAWRATFALKTALQVVSIAPARVARTFKTIR